MNTGWAASGCPRSTRRSRSAPTTAPCSAPISAANCGCADRRSRDGYLDHPEITAAQYVDGWLDTGDIAYRDGDGYLFICDRAKDMLIYKGYNVYPRELEEILVTHPSVSSAAVVGREAGAIGQEPVAFVVAEPGTDVDAAAVMAYVAERVLPYKKIRDVVVVDELPTSAAGKIQKVQLRQLLAAGV